MSRTPSPKTGGNSPIDPAVIRELAEIIADTGLTEIEVERGDLRVRVAKEPALQTIHAPAPQFNAPAASHSAPAPETPAPNDAASASAHPGAVKSPMVGTVYLASDPDTPPFMSVGKAVKEGDTLLLIEAMKTFNPVVAPRAGTVQEILVSDAQPVEFGEALVIIA